jgi:imidazoleglycerol phosphate synthase glutamine amidotransferase subunit HisH
MLNATFEMKVQLYVPENKRSCPVLGLKSQLIPNTQELQKLTANEHLYFLDSYMARLKKAFTLKT